MKLERTGRMKNKLKDIFSNEEVSLGGKIEFKDGKSYEQFIEAIQGVWNEGKTTAVEGIASINTNVKCGNIKYPISTLSEVSQVIIQPLVEEIPISVNTENGEKTIVFKRYQTTSEVILETEKNKIVYLKIVFKKDKLSNTFHYSTHLELAKDIKEIVEEYSTTIKFLEKLFNYNSTERTSREYEEICSIRDFFKEGKQFFEKLYSLEQALGILFKIDDLNNSAVSEVEELYFLIVEKKTLRLNAKLKGDGYTEMIMNEGSSIPEVGSEIVLTFISKVSYNICGQQIAIYTANLLSNAIVKEIQQNNGGGLKFSYTDTDNRPMYISMTGFRSEEEARKEMEDIMKKKESYTKALTVNEYRNKEEI